MAHGTTARGGDWTDAEIARFNRRDAAFLAYGMDAEGAERLARQMLYRDRPGEGDDRRVCFECAHMDRRSCTAGQPLMPLVMQRCPKFSIKKAS